jgi:hypothetical protein
MYLALPIIDRDIVSNQNKIHYKQVINQRFIQNTSIPAT